MSDTNMKVWNPRVSWETPKKTTSSHGVSSDTNEKLCFPTQIIEFPTKKLFDSLKN